jgi:hypothetical protein
MSSSMENSACSLESHRGRQLYRCNEFFSSLSQAGETAMLLIAFFVLRYRRIPDVLVEIPRPKSSNRLQNISDVGLDIRLSSTRISGCEASLIGFAGLGGGMTRSLRTFLRVLVDLVIRLVDGPY